MPDLDDIKHQVAEIDKRLFGHESECAANQRALLKEMSEMKTMVMEQAKELAAISRQLMARAGGSRAVRETVAYVIAILSIVAALYSGGLVHVGK